MPLTFQPSSKSVLMCDFTGFVPPEMVKVRPVIVLAKNKQNGKLITVVPLSTTEPVPMAACHHELSVNPLPDKQHVRCWAKCDMVITVSIDRLDRYKQKGTRNYLNLSINEPDFLAIRRAVVASLQLTTVFTT